MRNHAVLTFFMLVFGATLARADICVPDSKERIHVVKNKNGSIGFILYTETGCYGIGSGSFYNSKDLYNKRIDQDSQAAGISAGNGVRAVGGLIAALAVLGGDRSISQNSLDGLKMEDKIPFQDGAAVLDPKYFAITKECIAPVGTLKYHLETLKRVLGEVDTKKLAEAKESKQAPAATTGPTGVKKTKTTTTTQSPQ